jgi:hypothetical protein
MILLILTLIAWKAFPYGEKCYFLYMSFLEFVFEGLFALLILEIMNLI